ncbi:hypothetical protein CJ030_MR0G008582 [Morella rubra]|uniref:C2H2-type domain-containing protein n=1 Tax=Morella rubra TaxID=262757 RepID=A0A6A1UHN7_9ROSI|nr:hypothetical protein CJ030_MR0G008582 [Morella rubra]
MKKANECTSPGTVDDDGYGKPKPTEESCQYTRLDIHICRFCGKEFKGGKALGGHTRIHFLGTKKLQLPAKRIKKYRILGHSALDRVDINERENLFEGDDRAPMEKMEKENDFTPSGTMENVDNGQPKATGESIQYTSLGIRKVMGGLRKSQLQTQEAGHSEKIKNWVLGHPALDSESSGSASTIMSSDLVDGRQICRICNKDFPSKKSLFGHMKVHRQGKLGAGIHPPPPFDRNSSTSSATESDVTSKIDLLQFVPSSSKIDIDKRGWTSVIEAAVTLMWMSRCIPSGKELNRPLPASYNFGSRTNRAVINGNKSRVSDSNMDQRIDPSAVKKQGMNKTDETGREERDEKRRVEQTERKNAEGGRLGELAKDGCRIIKKKIKVKFSRGKESHDSEAEELGSNIRTNVPDWYECSKRDNSFLLFQAFGGHQSIHERDHRQTSSSSAETSTGAEKRLS